MKVKVALSLLLFSAFCLWGKYAIEPRVSASRAAHLTLKPVRATFQARALKKYNLGFSNFLSSLIWVGLLQNHEEVPLEEGSVSWEYSRLFMITTLDPNFLSAYSFGGIFLSVLRRDKLGAKLILEKYVERKPYAWRPRYLLAYHLFYEMNDFEQGSEQMLKSASYEGAPHWLSALGVRLLSETGATGQALRISIDLYQQVMDVRAKERLRLRIRALNFAFQKSAWKKALQLYRETHKREPRNLDELKPTFGRHARQIASVVLHRGFDPEVASLLQENFAFKYDSALGEVISVLSEETLGFQGIVTYKTAEKKREE